MDVKELDIDLIDHINPFDAAYAILAKAMNEGTLRQVQAAIAARKTTLTEEEARALAVRAVQWKRERGTLSRNHFTGSVGATARRRRRCLRPLPAESGC